MEIIGFIGALMFYGIVTMILLYHAKRHEENWRKEQIKRNTFKIHEVGKGEDNE